MRLYGKASAASTKKGAASWSAGASISAPLVNDRVGISLSAFTKKDRSEEHTSELQSLMRISYAVFCLKKKKINNDTNKSTKHKKHDTYIHTKRKRTKKT